MAAQIRSHQKRSRKFTSKIKEESSSPSLLHENHIAPQIEEREDLFAQAIGWRSSTTIPVQNPDKHKTHRSRSHTVSPAHKQDNHNTIPKVMAEDNHEISTKKPNSDVIRMEDDNAIILGKCYASIESVVYELDGDPSQKFVAYFCGDESDSPTTNAIQIVTVDPYALASDTSESECSCFCDSDEEVETKIEDPIHEIESEQDNKALLSPMVDQAMSTDIRWNRNISISLPQSPIHPPEDFFEHNSFTFEDLKPSDIERMIANSINILDTVQIDGLSDPNFGTNCSLMAGNAINMKTQNENDNVGQMEKGALASSTSFPATVGCQDLAADELEVDLVKQPVEKQAHAESDSSKNDSELKMDEATSILFDKCLEKVMNSSDLIFDSDDYSTIINDFGGEDIPIESPSQPKESKPIFDFEATTDTAPVSANSNSTPNRNFIMSTPKKPIKASLVSVVDDQSQLDGYQNFTANISKKAMNFDNEDIIDIESISDGENVPVLAASNLDSLLEQFEATESLHMSKKPLKEEKPGNGMIHLDHDYCSPEKKQVLLDRKNLKTGLGRGKNISIRDGFKGETTSDNPSDHSYTMPGQRKVRRSKEQAVSIQKSSIETLTFVPNKPRSFTKQQSLLKPAVKEEIKKVTLLKQTITVKPEVESIKQEPTKSEFGKDTTEGPSVSLTQSKQIEKVVPLKKKLNLEEYKRRRGTAQVRSCEGSRVSSPVTVPSPHLKTYSTPNSPVNLEEMNLQPVKTDGPLQEANTGISSLNNTTPPQIFDPIAEATKKALKMKKIKAKICPEDKIIQSKIPKQDDMVILPLATMNGRLLPMIKKASEVVPCEPSDEPPVKPQCEEYEEIIMVSIGVNTEPVQEVPCAKATPRGSSINFKICKKTAVLKSNIFKETAEIPNGETPSSAGAFDSSLISSIKSVMAQKDKHPTEPTSTTRKVSAPADIATTQEHGEDKVIMHLKKDRMKPLTLSAYSQTDSNFVEIIKVHVAPVKLSDVRKRTRSPSTERSSYRSRRARKSRSSERSRASDSSSRSRYRSQRHGDIHRDERSRRTRSRSRDNQRRYSDYDNRSHKSGRSSGSNNSLRSSYGRHRSFRRRSRSRSYSRNGRDHHHNISDSILRKNRTVSESSRTSSTGSTSSVSTSYSSSSRGTSSSHSSHRQEEYKPASPRKLEPMEERRVVFVGRLEKNMDREQMRRMFSRFGYVREVTLHKKEDGSRYGFVTFAKAQQSYQVVECASKDPELQRYDVSFGGRRAFCRHLYSDLDDLGPFEESGYYADTVPARPVIYQKSSSNFDTLLQEMKQAVEKKRQMQRTCKEE